MEFLKETPTEDIIEKVEEENGEYQIFFISDAGLNFTCLYGDQDKNGHPVG